jgi:hypothetical protein
MSDITPALEALERLCGAELAARSVSRAFDDLYAQVDLGRAIALLLTERPCRHCGTPSADCDARYEDTLSELCCRQCEVYDTSELHDPAGGPWEEPEPSESELKEDARNAVLAEDLEHGWAWPPEVTP